MKAAECQKRACECAANAAISTTEAVALEYLTLAGQWRVLALRDDYVGILGELAPPDPRPTEQTP